MTNSFRAKESEAIASIKKLFGEKGGMRKFIREANAFLEDPSERISETTREILNYMRNTKNTIISDAPFNGHFDPNVAGDSIVFTDTSLCDAKGLKPFTFDIRDLDATKNSLHEIYQDCISEGYLLSYSKADLDNQIAENGKVYVKDGIINDPDIDFTKLPEESLFESCFIGPDIQLNDRTIYKIKFSECDFLGDYKGLKFNDCEIDEHTRFTPETEKAFQVDVDYVREVVNENVEIDYSEAVSAEENTAEQQDATEKPAEPPVNTKELIPGTVKDPTISDSVLEMSEEEVEEYLCHLGRRVDEAGHKINEDASFMRDNRDALNEHEKAQVQLGDKEGGVNKKKKLVSEVSEHAKTVLQDDKHIDAIDEGKSTVEPANEAGQIVSDLVNSANKTARQQAVDRLKRDWTPFKEFVQDLTGVVRESTKELKEKGLAGLNSSRNKINDFLRKDRIKEVERQKKVTESIAKEIEATLKKLATVRAVKDMKIKEIDVKSINPNVKANEIHLRHLEHQLQSSISRETRLTMSHYNHDMHAPTQHGVKRRDDIENKANMLLSASLHRYIIDRAEEGWDEAKAEAGFKKNHGPMHPFEPVAGIKFWYEGDRLNIQNERMINTPLEPDDKGLLPSEKGIYDFINWDKGIGIGEIKEITAALITDARQRDFSDILVDNIQYGIDYTNYQYLSQTARAYTNRYAEIKDVHDQYVDTIRSMIGADKDDNKEDLADTSDEPDIGDDN